MQHIPTRNRWEWVLESWPGSWGCRTPRLSPMSPRELVNPQLIKRTAWLAENGRHPCYRVGMEPLKGYSRMIHTRTTGVATFISSLLFTKGAVRALSQTAQGAGCRSGPVWLVHLSKSAFSFHAGLPWHGHFLLLVSLLTISVWDHFKPSPIKCVTKQGSVLEYSLHKVCHQELETFTYLCIHSFFIQYVYNDYLLCARHSGKQNGRQDIHGYYPHRAYWLMAEPHNRV